MTSIVDKILAISATLDAQRLPYAFGGALALAFCTERARGTIDIDVNVFVGQEEAGKSIGRPASAHQPYRDGPSGPRT